MSYKVINKNPLAFGFVEVVNGIKRKFVFYANNNVQAKFEMDRLLVRIPVMQETDFNLLVQQHDQLYNRLL